MEAPTAESLELVKPVYGAMATIDGKTVFRRCKRFRCDGCNVERTYEGTCQKCKIQRRKEGPPRLCAECGKPNPYARAELCKLCRALLRPGSKELKAKANRENREKREAREVEEAKAAEARRSAEAGSKVETEEAIPMTGRRGGHAPARIAQYHCYSFIIFNRYTIHGRGCQNKVVRNGDYCGACIARGWPQQDGNFHRADPHYTPTPCAP